MANADKASEVKVDNANEGKVKSEENEERTPEPAYVMEIEVNANGEVVDQSSHKTQGEKTDGNAVQLTELTVYGGKEFDAIKSIHNYFQQPASSTSDPRMNNVDATVSSGTETAVDQTLLENIAKVVNSNVSVVHDSGQVIIVLRQDSELSDSDLEAIQLQIAKSEERKSLESTQCGVSFENTTQSEPLLQKRLESNGHNTEDIPIPEPSCFTEQTSENISTVRNEATTNEVRICYQCKAEFNSADELVYHFVQEHSTSVQCQHCEIVFPSIADANQHKKQRHIELQCTMCKKTYYGALSLNQHIKLRHSKSTKCGTCYKYFDSREEMEEHIEQEHKIHKCPFCGKGFYFQTSLGNHVESEHGLSTLDSNLVDEHITVKGNYHQVRFIPADKMKKLTAQNYSTHNKRVESRITKPECPVIKPEKPEEKETDVSVATQALRKSPRKHVFKCTYCGEGFYLKSTLTNHINTNHEGQSTVDTSTLDDLVGRSNHIKTEPETVTSPEQIVNDKTPDKMRRSSRGLLKIQAPLGKEKQPPEKIVNGTESPPHSLRKSPRKRVAEDSPPRTKKPNHDKTVYKCGQCGVSFKNNTQNEPVLLYTKHMAENHSEFICKKCDVDCENHRDFMTHMKSKHQMSTDVFVCMYCDQEFRTKRTFDVHTKDNWKRCPVAVGCTYCSQVFVSTKELTAHNKKEHKGKPVHYKV